MWAHEREVNMKGKKVWGSQQKYMGILLREPEKRVWKSHEIIKKFLFYT